VISFIFRHVWRWAVPAAILNKRMAGWKFSAGLHSVEFLSVLYVAYCIIVGEI
jgi:hypothetical protein